MEKVFASQGEVSDLPRGVGERKSNAAASRGSTSLRLDEEATNCSLFKNRIALLVCDLTWSSGS
jgi:hypothetical protein